MTLEDLVNLFQLWAVQHKQIKHGQGGKTRFLKSGSEVLLKNLGDKLDLGNFCIIVYEDDFEGRIGNNGAEQYRDELQLGFEIIKLCDLEDEAMKTTIQSQAKTICVSLWRRMLYHQRNRQGFFENGRLKLGEMTYTYVSGGPENVAGCFARFSLQEPIFGIDPNYSLSTDFDV